MDGYKRLHAAENWTQMFAAIADNWDWFYNNSQFPELFRRQLPPWYSQHDTDLNQVGIYYNAQDIDHGIVFVDSPDKLIHVTGTAMALLLAPSRVYGDDHADIHCKDFGTKSHIYIDGQAYAYLYNCYCEAGRYSTVDMTRGSVVARGRATVTLQDNSVCIDYGHNRIMAYDKSCVFTDDDRKVEVRDGAKVCRISSLTQKEKEEMEA